MEHTNLVFDINQPETIEGLITPDTKILFAESPTNPLLILFGIVRNIAKSII
jgi:O-succinylhomoserine sulfhydrylase